MIEGFETFSPQERAYLDSKGEKPIDDAPAVEEEATEEVENEAETDEAAEIETTDEAEAEDEEGPKTKKDVGRVPLRKLREEEDKRKAAEADRDALKEQFARADERLRLLFNAQQQEQTKEPPPPDKSQDPLGFMEWQQQQIERLSQTQQQQREEYQRQEQTNAIDNAYRSAWYEFAGKTPDAMAAHDHFCKATSAILRMHGYREADIPQLLINEQRKAAIAALRNGKSPAEWIYGQAMEMGFQPKAKAQVIDASKTAEADIERRQKAQSASKSLSSAGGTRGGQSITAAELASMSDDEFEEVRAKLGERALRKLMGE